MDEVGNVSNLINRSFEIRADMNRMNIQVRQDIAEVKITHYINEVQVDDKTRNTKIRTHERRGVLRDD